MLCRIFNLFIAHRGQQYSIVPSLHTRRVKYHILFLCEKIGTRDEFYTFFTWKFCHYGHESVNLGVGALGKSVLLHCDVYKLNKVSFRVKKTLTLLLLAFVC
jgi:hypothetical protein